MRYRQLVQRLRQPRCQEIRARESSRRIWHSPVIGGLATIPDWGSPNLAPGAARVIIRELGIERAEFRPIK